MAIHGELRSFTSWTIHTTFISSSFSIIYNIRYARSMRNDFRSLTLSLYARMRCPQHSLL